MADVKKVEKTAESTGFQNVGTGEAYPHGGAPIGKTLAETRALRQEADAAEAEAQQKVRDEVAERDAKPKGEAKPSKRTEAEMAGSSKK